MENSRPSILMDHHSPLKNTTWDRVTEKPRTLLRAAKKSIHFGTDPSNNMKKSLCVLLWITTSLLFPALGQDTDLWQAMKNQYPDEPAVFIERSEVLNLLIEGDSLRIFNDVNEDIMHLKEQ